MENASPLLVNSLVIIKFVNCVFTNDKVRIFRLYKKWIESFCDCIWIIFFELQMKELLEDIEETWKIKHTNSEKKILQHYAEKSRTFTIRYASKLPLFKNCHFFLSDTHLAIYEKLILAVYLLFYFVILLFLVYVIICSK